MGKVKTAKRFAVGAALAGAAGYIAGIITAPKSGRETREDISRTADASMIEIEKQLKAMHTELGGLVDEARDYRASGKGQKQLQELVDKAKESKEKMRVVISSLHEGEATDKDLKHALSDARNAIQHIKDFLEK